MLNPETLRGFSDAHYKPFLRNHKKIQYEYEFTKLDVIYEYLGDKLIDEVSKLDVLAFKTWLLERPRTRGKNEKSRSDASADRYLSRLRGLLNFAEEVGKRKSHISFKNILAKENPKQAYISFEEFMRVPDKCYEVPKCNRWKRDRSHMRLTLMDPTARIPSVTHMTLLRSWTFTGGLKNLRLRTT